MRFWSDGGVITLTKMKSGGSRGFSAEAEPSGKLTLVAKKCLRESHSRGCDSGRALISLGTSFSLQPARFVSSVLRRESAERISVR